MPSTIWRRYLTWMLSTLVAVIALCGALNVFIDPLGVFGSPRIAGINERKPYLDHHRELARWKAAKRICPSAGIFGNSRAEIGFDPEHPAFRDRGLEAFNHAIPGTGISTGHRQLKWLYGAGCTPRVVIVGVEFFDFLGGSTHDPRRALAADPAPDIDARTIGETVFSITAARDALKTVLLQRASYPATITPRGFNPLLNYLPEVERAGQYPLFRQRAVENLKNWSRKPRRLRPEGGGPSSDDAELEGFLATSTSQGTVVYVLIYPYHAQLRLMMERAGLSPLFAQWKESIFETARKYESPTSTVKVWDFSGISDETLEAIPLQGDRRSRMNYYWEAGHFKRALGDRVLNQLLANDPGFGVLMHGDMIHGWLEKDRERVAALLGMPSPLAAEVTSLFTTQDVRK